METKSTYNELSNHTDNPWEGMNVLEYNPKETMSFRYADLSGANFSGCNLSGCDFSYAKLNNAIFNDATLVGAIFSYADLTSASFVGAVFSPPRSQ